MSSPETPHAGPMDAQRALSFVMLVGKHRGKPLSEILKTDPSYVEYVARKFERGRAVQRACELLVQQGLAGRGYEPR